MGSRSIRLRRLKSLAMIAALLTTPLWSTAADDPTDETNLQALIKRYQQESKLFYERLKEGGVELKKHPANVYLPEFVGVARQTKGTEGEVESLIWLARVAGRAASFSNPAAKQHLRERVVNHSEGQYRFYQSRR